MLDLKTATPLTANEYYDFVLNQYEPSPYERNELEDPRFFPGTYYAHVCRTRCYLVYREIVSRLSQANRLIDLGAFPGTLIRQLKILLKDKIHCYAVGQKGDEGFKKFMAPYVEDCLDLELDPFYLKSQQAIAIPFASGSFDVVLATEILEHLISPLEMLAESSRILRQGGVFIITTPNVSHLGAVLKLMMGKSNYERLDRSPMYLQKDPWRGHIRFYDKTELKTLFQRNGLEMISHRYYRELGWTHAKQSLLKRLAITLVDKCAPLYRECHFAVFKKV